MRGPPIRQEGITTCREMMLLALFPFSRFYFRRHWLRPRLHENTDEFEKEGCRYTERNAATRYR